MYILIWLVVSPPLKTMKVNWDDSISHLIWKNIKFMFQSPPTRRYWILQQLAIDTIDLRLSNN